jgi:hypothetical protein
MSKLHDVRIKVRHELEVSQALRCFGSGWIGGMLGLLLMAVSLAESLAAPMPPNFAWARQLGETKGNIGESLAVDKTGNVYVTGIIGYENHHSIGTHEWSSSGGKVFLAKYDPNGKLVWLQKAAGTGKDEGNGVTVDGAGNVYVAGYFSGKINFGTNLYTAKGNRDAFLAKYDSTGKLIWVQNAGGIGGAAESWKVAADEDGNVCVTGNFEGKADFGDQSLVSRSLGDGQSDMFVAKYNSAGKVLWVRQAGEMGANGGYGIATDINGAVYVTGRFADGRGEGISISFDKIKIANSSEDNLGNFIVKYDRDGKVLWAQATPGIMAYGTQNSIAIDKMQHIYLAGSFNFNTKFAGMALTNRAEMNDDIFLILYDSNGMVRWVRTAGGTAHDECYAVASDESGNAYLAGTCSEEAMFSGIRVQTAAHDPLQFPSPAYVAKYDPAGEVVWVKVMDAGRGFSPALGIQVSEDRDICITGFFGECLSFDSLTLKPAKNLLGQMGGNAFVAKLRGN